MNRPRKPLSRFRRWSRILVWATLAVVGTLRVLFPPEPVPLFQFGGGRPEGWGGPRMRRPPARVHPPATKVPADLPRIEIELARRDADILRSYYWNGWGGEGNERPQVVGVVREGGVTYTNVAIQLKGSAGSFRPFDDKPALTLNFNKHAKGQKFRGYSKISLNNSVQDPSYLCEALSREMFVAAGVPAPRAEHATVILNGRDLGLYVLTEGWGKPFLRQYFGNVDGNLYDSGFLQDITGNLEVNSGDSPTNHVQLARLIEAASEADRSNRWQRLSEVLDMDRFISFLAMEVMTCHWDGYALNRNNYRLFHDRATDRMVFLPHGLDQMFGGGRSSTDASILPPMQGIVARAVATTPEGRRRLLERMAALRDSVFVEERLTNRVQELSRRLRPTLEAYAPDLARDHDYHVADLCQRIGARARSISAQLASPPELLKFDAEGIAQLAGWNPRITSGGRRSVRFHRGEVRGMEVLGIAVVQGGGVGSWRTHALLDPGRYRFQGRVMTQGIGSGGGVGLRISGVRAGRSLVEDGVWTDLSFTFFVEDTESEVELIAELGAPEGEAIFEFGSLRLVKE